MKAFNLWSLMRLVTHLLRSSSLKCSKQTFTVALVIVNSFPLSVFASEINRETKKNLSLLWKISPLLMAFRNTKTRRNSRIKQSTSRLLSKQDFSGEAKSKLNTEAQLASLSYNLLLGNNLVVCHICIGHVGEGHRKR